MSVLSAMVRGLFAGVGTATNVVRSPVARVGFSMMFLLGYTVGARSRAGDAAAKAKQPVATFETPAAASADLRRTMLTDYGGPAIFSAFPAPLQETLILLVVKPAVWVASIGIEVGYALGGWVPLVVAQGLGGAAVVGVCVYGAWHFARLLVEVAN
jgi:hypothetical protein